MQTQIPKEFQETTDGVVRVISFNENHLNEKYISWLNDKDVVRYSEQRHFQHSLESCRKYYEHQILSDNYFLAIELVGKENRHVGNIGLTVNKMNNILDLSIIVGDKTVWGSGVGTRAWRLALNGIFNNLKFRMVTAGTMELNESMIKLMKRSGMKIECILPDRFIFEDNYVGLVVASITKDNFKI
jgi:ribosomal-protein-alanine N-acetyltransferase